MDNITLEKVETAIWGRVQSRHALLAVVDWISTLPFEIGVIWPTKWSLVKVLYILNRYFLADVLFYYLYFMVPNVETCRISFIVSGVITLIGIALAEAVIFIRLYALSGQSRIYRIWLPLQFIAVQVAGYCLGFFVKPVLLLLDVTLNAASSIVNIALLLLLPSTASTMFVIPQRVIHSILASRMILHLREHSYHQEKGHKFEDRLDLRIVSALVDSSPYDLRQGSKTMDAAVFISSIRNKIIAKHVHNIVVTTWIADWLHTLPFEVEVIWPVRWNLVKFLYLFSRYFPIDIIFNYIYIEGSDVEVRVRSLTLTQPNFKTTAFVDVSDLILRWLSIIPMGTLTRPSTCGLSISGRKPHICIYCLRFTDGQRNFDHARDALHWFYEASAYMEPLVEIFFRDGFVFFLFLVGSSVVNIVMLASLPPSNRTLFALPQRVIHSILASRMILHLRQE
ncbi:hypothetical protein EST38_g13753 [Candolleomyces aberdarensis]|uniref:DUF6533 domain-containing protein n=1 Tax=Candolleomyces aberdarensis TaxID=2316362 RepID=A0A4Q2D1F5_9AGAR|nr:hypothetical protein EST38_g13753 [Candolleomyces aberdarensis]